jgi:hypothetical protein
MKWLIPNARSRRPVRLALEPLEDRWVPATVRFSGSTLMISNPTIVGGSTSLTVTEGANGFTVMDQGKSNGTYKASTILITGSNAPNSIAVLLNGTGLSGNLSITGGNGNDTISVRGSTANDKISGSLTIAGGNRNCSFAVGDTANGLIVGGATQLYGGLGTDTVTLGNATTPAKFLGNLGLHAIAHAQLTATLSTLGTNYTLGSGLRIDEQLSPTSSGTKSDFVNVTFNSAAQSVPGALQIVDGFGSSTVALSLGTIGSLLTNLGQGSNSVSLGDGANPETVKGSASLTFGTGDNTVTINGGTVINSLATAGGSLALNMGDGINVYNLSGSGGFTVNGNMSITTPATATHGQVITFGGTVNSILGGGVDGNLTVNLGNGNNNFTFQGTISNGATFSYDAPPPGGHVTATGDDTVTVDVTNDALLNVNLFFGYGGGTLNWAGGNTKHPSGNVTGINGVVYSSNNPSLVDTAAVNYKFFPAS